MDAAPGWERLAPTPFATVVFRYRPEGMGEPEADSANERILERVNAGGEVYLSHTRVRGRLALRVAVGNLRTEERHLRAAWRLLRDAAA